MCGKSQVNSKAEVLAPYSASHRTGVVQEPCFGKGCVQDCVVVSRGSTRPGTRWKLGPAFDLALEASLTEPLGGGDARATSSSRARGAGRRSRGVVFTSLPGRDESAFSRICRRGFFAQVGYAGEAARRLPLPGAEAILASRPARRAEKSWRQIPPPGRDEGAFSRICRSRGFGGFRYDGGARRFARGYRISENIDKFR